VGDKEMELGEGGGKGVMLEEILESESLKVALVSSSQRAKHKNTQRKCMSCNNKNKLHLKFLFNFPTIFPKSPKP
jgi:hypothetical protein